MIKSKINNYPTNKWPRILISKLTSNLNKIWYNSFRNKHQRLLINFLTKFRICNSFWNNLKILIDLKIILSVTRISLKTTNPMINLINGNSKQLKIKSSQRIV